MEVVSVDGVSEETVVVALETTDRSPGSSKLGGSHILVAMGRVPNMEDIRLQMAGIKLHGSGHIVVDEQLRTMAGPDIYAAGDCAGAPEFTHMGWEAHRVIIGAISESLREGGITGRLVPQSPFTSPELARVGLTERETQEDGIKFRLAKAGAEFVFLRVTILGKENARTTLLSYYRW